MGTTSPNIADRLVHTYSVVACDPYTGQLGVAVQSHFFSVGSIVPWAEAGVGAVATQSFANADYGPEGLALMREGRNAEQALETLLKGDEEREIRQVALVDAKGTIAVHTGNRCIPAAGHMSGENFSVQANLMVNDSVWPAMKQAYEETSGDLADRMIAALEGAQEAGGDLRGQQAAAMLIVTGERQQKPWQGRLFDLRVDDHPQAIEELKRLVSIRKAWLLFEKSNELAHTQHVVEAVDMLKQAIALQPDLAELKFRGTEIMFLAGQPQEALAMFHEAFALEPVWAEMVPRMASIGLLPNDPTFLKYILDQRTENPR